MIYNLWNRVGLFLFLFVCLFLFLLLDFFRLLYKSLQKELRKHCSKDNERSSWSKKTKQMQAFAVLFIDHRYPKALLAVALYWKTLPFLRTPHVNNAKFQRINFVKLKFIWISLNVFKKNKYVIDINIGAYLLFLSIPKEYFFYIELNGSLHDFPRVLLSNLLISLLNYPRYWFLSILHSPFWKCFYSIAIAGSIVWIEFICDYIVFEY